MHDFQLNFKPKPLGHKNCLCSGCFSLLFDPKADAGCRLHLFPTLLRYDILELNELIECNSIRIKIISPVA